MANRVGSLRTRLFSENAKAPDVQTIVDTVESELDDDEFVHQQLLGKTDHLTVEKDGQKEQLTVDGTARTLVILTDRKLLFVVASSEDTLVRPISYIDIKDVDVDDGLLRSALTVAIWPEGTYRLTISDSTALGAAVSTLTHVSQCWQYAVSMLEAANETLPAVGEAIERGELGTVRSERAVVEEKLSRARNRVKQTLDESAIEDLPALRQRIDSTETELYRTEMHARIVRAATLMSEGNQKVESREYTSAVKQLWRARDHLENAQMLARRASIEEPSVIESRLERAEHALKNIRVRPLAQAKQARERAEKTDQEEVRVAQLNEAFEHYRDALTAGWGTDFTFAGDTETIRTDLQEVIAALTRARCAYAESLIETSREAGQKPEADKAIDLAKEQVSAAQQLTKEFRAADEELVKETAKKLERTQLE